MSSEWHGGKGSAPRPMNRDKFNENWDRIFGKDKVDSSTKKELQSEKRNNK